MKLLSKLVAVGLIFVAPLVLVIQRYNAVETKIESSFGIVPTIFVLIVVVTAFSFVSQQFLEMVRTNKFGFLSIAFFGVLLGLLLFSALFTLSAILNTAQSNYDAFVANYEYHIETLWYALIFVISGIGISGVYLATQIKKP